MSRPLRDVAVLATAALTVMTAVAGPAAAGSPDITRGLELETFVNPILTDDCGFEVTTTAAGRFTSRALTRSNGSTTNLVTLNITLTHRSAGNAVRERNVGSSTLRVLRDGTETITLAGQQPGSFTGAYKLNLTTGEITLLPRKIYDSSRVCARLNPS